MSNNTNTNANAAERTAAAAAMSSAGQSVDTIADTLGVSVRTVRKYLAASVVESPAVPAVVESPAVPAVVESPAVPAVVATGRAHAGMDIGKGLRLLEDRASGEWYALKGGSMHRPGLAARVGVVMPISAGRFLAIGEGTQTKYVESLKDAGAFIASTVTVKKSTMSAIGEVKADIADSAKARNKFLAHKNGLNHAAYVTLKKRIGSLTARTNDAQVAVNALAGVKDRAKTANASIIDDRLAAVIAQQQHTIRTLATNEERLNAEEANLRTLRDKALGMGITQAEVEALVKSVKRTGDLEAQAHAISQMFAG